MRRGVAERLLAQQQVRADAALLDYLADRPADSVRALTAMVQRVVGAATAQEKPLTAGLAREELEGQAPAGERRRTSGFRTSGIVVSSAGGIRSREKMVWDWPEPSDRVLEEPR